ncbi:MAG: DUF6476 family protein [Rhodobacteraceae bacterium]|jgi:Family of unknown function (DUF6476)|nr:DUF6476 family protein [Paracoccaceae bacterium]
MKDEASDGLPPGLRFLKALVIVLAVSMIAGVITIVALLVTRLNGTSPLPLPETISLPDGAKAQAVTAGADWYAVVTTDNRILIFDRLTGDLRQEIAVTP